MVIATSEEGDFKTRTNSEDIDIIAGKIFSIGLDLPSKKSEELPLYDDEIPFKEMLL